MEKALTRTLLSKKREPVSSLIDRRTVLKSAGAVITAAACGGPASETGERLEDSLSPVPVLNHRSYLGWITDLATEPDPTAAWPSMRLDEKLLKDYQESFALLNSLGFKSMSVWGLYVSRAWPVDIESSVTPERGKLVERLIDAGHQQGIKIYSGLGIYSWGFDEIIRANPGVSKDNANAMCASEPESWKWMQKVLDFVFQRFPIDGVSMQSADQGRCSCSQCSEYSDAEYHALVNIRTAEYIRSQYPDKLVAVNSWGMRFEDEATLPSLIKMSEHLDYLIDVHDTSRKKDLGYRKTIIDSLHCDFGTLGGPQVEPPQHWRRDRWFLPTLRRVGDHLQELAGEGGRAVEYFFHILANPSCELSTWLAGKVMAEPETPWEVHLASTVEELYQVSQPDLRDDLVQLFLDSEDCYFRHLPPRLSGTISMEPLVTDNPGPPIYVTRRLNEEQRNSYHEDLLEIHSRAKRLAGEVPAKGRMELVIRCIGNVIEDIEQNL